MKNCAIHDAGSIELLFYGELDEGEREAIARHLPQCALCRTALEDLDVIRAALAARPEVSAPPAGDWSGFMERLDVSLDIRARQAVVPFTPQRPLLRRPLLGALATAALLAIVAASVFFAWHARERLVQPQPPQQAVAADPAAATDLEPIQARLASVSARHLERSKLVVLGLATRESTAAEKSDWTYERELASSLLNDTRLYRMAAEQRGLTSLAGVMRDLELVLLQTSMAEASDDAALPRIQRLIRKRGLVEKMDVVGTTGLLP
jgi:hypothetical protein